MNRKEVEKEVEEREFDRFGGSRRWPETVQQFHRGRANCIQFRETSMSDRDENKHLNLKFRDNMIRDNNDIR